MAREVPKSALAIVRALVKYIADRRRFTYQLNFVRSIRSMEMNAKNPQLNVGTECLSPSIAAKGGCSTFSLHGIHPIKERSARE